jgi:hypothetical protein
VRLWTGRWLSMADKTSTKREANNALDELLEAAADADAKLMGWLTDCTALVQIECGAKFEVFFAPSPTLDSPAMYWTAAVLGMSPSTPSSVGRWLVELNQLQTPEQNAIDEAEAAAERQANKPW